MARERYIKNIQNTESYRSCPSKMIYIRNPNIGKEIKKIMINNKEYNISQEYILNNNNCARLKNKNGEIIEVVMYDKTIDDFVNRACELKPTSFHYINYELKCS